MIRSLSSVVMRELSDMELDLISGGDSSCTASCSKGGSPTCTFGQTITCTCPHGEDPDITC